MFKDILNSFFNIIYPHRCLVCKKNILPYKKDEFLCAECLNSIKKNLPPFCIRCGRHLENGNLNICKNCQNKTYYFDRAFSTCLYEGVIKELLHQFKYNNKDFLGRFLSHMLIEFINTYHLKVKDFDFVVPLPLHPRKLRQREYNQSLILAEAVAKEFNIVLLKDALFKIKDTVSQTELDIKERIKNVADSFKVNPKVEIKDKNILMVDDILTTGATSSEAARILKSAGAKEVILLTLAS